MATAPDRKDTYRFMREQPRLGARVYLAPSAVVSGSVRLGDDVSVWPMTVIRGDVNRIAVGARTNIQDGSILHVTHDSRFAPGGHATATVRPSRGPSGAA